MEKRVVEVFIREAKSISGRPCYNLYRNVTFELEADGFKTFQEVSRFVQDFNSTPRRTFLYRLVAGPNGRATSY